MVWKGQLCMDTCCVFSLLDLCMMPDERDECETGEKEIYVNEDYHIPCL